MAIFSVVIPVYRAENCLDELHRRLTETLSSITPEYEIVLVEDNSPDASWRKIQVLAQRDSRIKGIRLSRNFGQHCAITAGLDRARGDWVVVMDCDLQDRPEDIPLLYQKALSGHKVVRAVRIERSHSRLKNITSAIFYLLFRALSGLAYDGRSANFRILHQSVVQKLLLYRESLRFFGALCQIAGYDGVALEVKHDPRFAGSSSYSIKKLLKLALETILAYSNRPLYIVIYIGLFISLLSFSFACLIFYKAYFHNYSVQGWPSLMILISFSLGLILACLGVIGLYLAKVFDEVKSRPIYVIDELTE